MPCRITHQVDERNMDRPEHANSHLLLLSIILESNFDSIFQNPHSPIGLIRYICTYQADICASLMTNYQNYWAPSFACQECDLIG
jgi:hypothetical protein